MESVVLKTMLTAENFEQLLKEKNIKTNTVGDLRIFNYGIASDFSDPFVQESRGIIIDTVKKQVVCWPFRKFGNWAEEYADDIDWNTARVEEKIDGSIVKLWHYNDIWHWSTNACIDAKNATVPEGLTFDDIIYRAENYKDIPFDSLDKTCTYLFELTSPYNRVVIPYRRIMLWHIGTRSNITGEEMSVEIDIQKPKVFPMKTMEECLDAAVTLNSDETVKAEGFVVVDKNWHRIKIKSPEYIAVHRHMNNGIIKKDDAIRLLLDEPEKAEILAKSSEVLHVQLMYYAYKIAEFKLTISDYIAYARNLYAELSNSRKAVAAVIADDNLSTFGFAAIGNEKTAEEILKRDVFHLAIIRNIEDYQRPFEKVMEKRRKGERK